AAGGIASVVLPLTSGVGVGDVVPQHGVAGYEPPVAVVEGRVVLEQHVPARVVVEPLDAVAERYRVPHHRTGVRAAASLYPVAIASLEAVVEGHAALHQGVDGPPGIDAVVRVAEDHAAVDDVVTPGGDTDAVGVASPVL